MTELFYQQFITVLISFFCGFVIGIERTRVSAQYGARDHIFFSMIATSVIILYEQYFTDNEIWLIIVVFAGMILYLLIGSVYRLFHENDTGYTTTLSMILAMIMGILSYYNYYLSIAISVIFLIVLSTKKQFNKIKNLQRIEWKGTIEFIAIVVLLFILIPEDIILLNLNLRSLIIIFITILAIKYFSYFLLKFSPKHNLYYISLLGGFAHSEATTVQLAEIGASSSSIWLLIQTMLGRMILILLLGAPSLLTYAFFPIAITMSTGLIFSFLILHGKDTQFELNKIKNPLSIKSAVIFVGTYILALVSSLILDFLLFENFIGYSMISFLIGLLSGGASSLFSTTSYLSGYVNEGQVLIMLAVGLSAAILNKIFYALKFLADEKNKKRYTIKLVFYQTVTIFLLFSITFITIGIFSLSLI